MAKPVNWFPGHMAKTLRIIGERLKLVDIVIETCDARIPVSSRNPEFSRIIGDKLRLLVLGKKDLADPAVTEAWIAQYRDQGIRAIVSDNTKRSDVDRIRSACLDMCKDRIERARAKGRIFRPVRAMVVGIPNTGKSTLINTLSGRAVTKTEDRPGVTRSPQWARTPGGLELMDMPGALWANLGDHSHQLHLAATGAIKDDVLDIEEIAYETLGLLVRTYPEKIISRFGEYDVETPLPELFEEIARRRGCVLSGGRVDLRRFSVLLLDELRSGRIGLISLEMPNHYADKV